MGHDCILDQDPDGRPVLQSPRPCSATRPPAEDPAAHGPTLHRVLPVSSWAPQSPSSSHHYCCLRKSAGRSEDLASVRDLDLKLSGLVVRNAVSQVQFWFYLSPPE